MSVIYLALPVALLLVGAAFLAFRWSVRSGQLDDLDTPGYRVLFDDEIVSQSQESLGNQHPCEKRDNRHLQNRRVAK